jgi:hypothetical protein
MIGLFAFVAFQKSVTLPNHAMRLDALLKELSAASGTTYKASGPMIGRIVLVAGPARPANAICTDLAAATWGKWRAVGNEWLLDEDREAIAAREKARLAGRVGQVKLQLDKLRLESARPFNEAAAKALLGTLKAYDEAETKDPNKSWTFRQKAEKEVPANLAIRRIVASIDPVDLATLEIGNRVYSDIPTRLQKSLPPAAKNAIRQLERDQAVWTRAYPDNADFMEAHRSKGWMSMDPRGHVDNITPGSLRLLLKVQAFEHGQTLFSGNFVDKLGRPRQFGEFSLEFRNGLGRSDPAPKVDKSEPKLKLSPEAMAFSDSRRGKPASPLLRPIFLNPERRDPLDLLNGEGLRGVAKARNASLVAWLGDEATNFTVGSGESASEFLKDFWDMKYEVRQKPGSILIRPLFGAENIERTRLGALVRIADIKGFVPLDDYADYAAASAPTALRFGDPMTSIALSIIMPGAMEASRVDWELLRLWGGFTRSQRQALMKGGLVRWTDTPKGVRDLFVDSILNAESYEIQQTVYEHGNVYSVLDHEPTELLANGLSFGDGLLGTGSAQEGIFASSDDENPYNGGIADAWSLASAMMSREKKPNEQHFDGLPKVLPSEFRHGQIFNFGFRLPISRTLAWQKSGRYGEFDMRERPIALEAMPEAFRKRYEQAMESIRKQPGNQ